MFRAKAKEAKAMKALLLELGGEILGEAKSRSIDIKGGHRGWKHHVLVRFNEIPETFEDRLREFYSVDMYVNKIKSPDHLVRALALYERNHTGEKPDSIYSLEEEFMAKRHLEEEAKDPRALKKIRREMRVLEKKMNDRKL